MTPFEQGRSDGERLREQRPLPMELRERLAVLLRPAAEQLAERSAS